MRLMLRPPFSVWVLLGLLAVFGASCLMFWVHVRRWTGNRQWLNLRDWSNRNRFKMFGTERATVPVPLAGLTLPPPRALVALAGKRFVMVQMETPGGAPRGAGAVASVDPPRWNVLVRELPSFWPTTALRPAQHERSLIDLFALPSFPALSSGGRFTVHGADAPAARAVVASMLMALLPHDLGLILHGRRLILDFSTRPFDGIELSRIVALVEQLTTHLPAVPGSGKR
jgi:hypothetical protein